MANDNYNRPLSSPVIVITTLRVIVYTFWKAFHPVVQFSTDNLCWFTCNLLRLSYLLPIRVSAFGVHCYQPVVFLKSAQFLLGTTLCGDFSGSRIQFRFEENADEATHLQAHRSGGRRCTDVDERRFAQFSLRVS